jgi:hypothetical protein
MISTPPTSTADCLSQWTYGGTPEAAGLETTLKYSSRIPLVEPDPVMGITGSGSTSGSLHFNFCNETVKQTSYAVLDPHMTLTK